MKTIIMEIQNDLSRTIFWLTLENIHFVSAIKFSDIINVVTVPITIINNVNRNFRSSL